jgi:hypothetical protein
MRHRWNRFVGVGGEAFTEVVPRSRSIRFLLPLPDRGSLDPAPLRERIHAAFAAFRKDPAPAISYAYLCRNVEAIEMIPTLIETYRKKEPGCDGVVDGLGQIAAILSGLDRACRYTLQYKQKESSYRNAELENRVRQLCIWANVPEEARTDVPRALAQVREKIDADARLLVDFAMDESSRNFSVWHAPAELGTGLGARQLSRIIDSLARTPPTTLGGVSCWKYPLWRLGVHFDDLMPLFTSEDPMLVLLACNATPDEELKGAIAAKVLARLKEIRPKMSDVGAQRRGDELIQRCSTRN